MNDKTIVTQADREAAAEIFGAYESMQRRNDCIDGKLDMHPTTEAFADHRFKTRTNHTMPNSVVEALRTKLYKWREANVCLYADDEEADETFEAIFATLRQHDQGERDKALEGPSNGVNCPNCGVRLPADYENACPDCGATPMEDGVFSALKGATQ